MTEAQEKYVKMLLFKNERQDDAAELALQFSNGRTNELKELSHNETQQLIEFIGEKQPPNPMVNKLLYLAHNIGWELKDGKIDIERLNAWCVKYTTAKKPLNKIPEKELPIVVSVFEKMHQAHLNNL